MHESHQLVKNILHIWDRPSAAIHLCEHRSGDNARKKMKRILLASTQTYCHTINLLIQGITKTELD